MITILYEDNHLIVVDKPHNLLTQPSGTKEKSMEEEVKIFIKKRDQKPGNVFLEAIHRLDKPVAGIVLFAKTSKALKRLQQAMREKKISKTYLAWVEGEVEPKKGKLENFLLHDSFKAKIVEEKKEKAKLAILNYIVKKVEKGNSLVEIELITGRYHQIRAQFAHRGHPILGDKKYGAKSESNKGIKLSHEAFSFPHPITKKQLHIERWRCCINKPLSHRDHRRNREN